MRLTENTDIYTLDKTIYPLTSMTLPELSDTAKSLTPGAIFEHYKGKQYMLLYVARHSETLEEFVVYQALYGEKNVWVRPLEMFFEEVTIQEHTQPRFKKILNTYS